MDVFNLFVFDLHLLMLILCHFYCNVKSLLGVLGLFVVVWYHFAVVLHHWWTIMCTQMIILSLFEVVLQCFVSILSVFIFILFWPSSSVSSSAVTF